MNYPEYCSKEEWLRKIEARKERKRLEAEYREKIRLEVEDAHRRDEEKIRYHCEVIVPKFFVEWFEKYGTRPAPLSDLAEIAVKCELIPEQFIRDPRARKGTMMSFGRQLSSRLHPPKEMGIRVGRRSRSGSKVTRRLDVIPGRWQPSTSNQEGDSGAGGREAG